MSPITMLLQRKSRTRGLVSSIWTTTTWYTKAIIRRRCRRFSCQFPPFAKIKKTAPRSSLWSHTRLRDIATLSSRASKADLTPSAVTFLQSPPLAQTQPAAQATLRLRWREFQQASWQGKDQQDCEVVVRKNCAQTTQSLSSRHRPLSTSTSKKYSSLLHSTTKKIGSSANRSTKFSPMESV